MLKELARKAYYLWTYMVFVIEVFSTFFVGYICLSHKYNVLGDESVLLLSIDSCFISASICINNMIQAERSAIAFLNGDSKKTEHVRLLSAFLYCVCTIIVGNLSGSFILIVFACIIIMACIIMNVTRM